VVTAFVLTSYFILRSRASAWKLFIENNMQELQDHLTEYRTDPTEQNKKKLDLFIKGHMERYTISKLYHFAKLQLKNLVGLVIISAIIANREAIAAVSKQLYERGKKEYEKTKKRQSGHSGLQDED
jgi:hypothetical protein